MTQKSKNLPAKTYGFIGLGIMGWGMAKNIRQKISKESTLYICELNEARRDQWVAETAGKVVVAAHPAEVVSNSDFIITMLPRGEHVRHVFTEPHTGLLSSRNTGKIFIDCSTIDVKTSQDISRLVHKSGAGVFADAPVSGGQSGANDGLLTFMVGGDAQIFEQIKPVLDMMAKPGNVFYCGKAGAGLATKLINNYISAINMIGVCEGMNLGRLYGLDPSTLASVINTSTGMSRNSREQNPVKGVSPSASSATDFKGGFSTELCRGVLGMALELGKQLEAPTVLGPLVESFYDQAQSSDKCKGKDFRSIYKLFSEDDGRDVLTQNIQEN